MLFCALLCSLSGALLQVGTAGDIVVVSALGALVAMLLTVSPALTVVALDALIRRVLSSALSTARRALANVVAPLTTVEALNVSSLLLGRGSPRRFVVAETAHVPKLAEASIPKSTQLHFLHVLAVAIGGWNGRSDRRAVVVVHAVLVHAVHALRKVNRIVVTAANTAVHRVLVVIQAARLILRNHRDNCPRLHRQRRKLRHVHLELLRLLLGGRKKNLLHRSVWWSWLTVQFWLG